MNAHIYVCHAVMLVLSNKGGKLGFMTSDSHLIGATVLHTEDHDCIQP